MEVGNPQPGPRCSQRLRTVEFCLRGTRMYKGVRSYLPLLCHAQCEVVNDPKQSGGQYGVPLLRHGKQPAVAHSFEQPEETVGLYRGGDANAKWRIPSGEVRVVRDKWRDVRSKAEVYNGTNRFDGAFSRWIHQKWRACRCDRRRRSTSTASGVTVTTLFFPEKSPEAKAYVVPAKKTLRPSRRWLPEWARRGRGRSVVMLKSGENRAIPGKFVP